MATTLTIFSAINSSLTVVQTRRRQFTFTTNIRRLTRVSTRSFCSWTK